MVLPDVVQAVDVVRARCRGQVPAARRGRELDGVERVAGALDFVG